MKIELFAKKLVDKQIKNPSIFLIVFGIIFVLMVPGIFNLIGNVEPSLEKVLPQNIDEIKTMNDMRAQFGADMIYIVIQYDDIRSPELLRYIDILSNKIRNNENMLEVMSLADLVKPIPEDYELAKRFIDGDPRSSMFHSDNYDVTFIQVRSDTGSTASVVKKAIENINDDIKSVEEYNPGATVKITGFSAIDKVTFEIIMKDFGVITIFSMLAVMLVVWITFKSLLKGMLPMVVVINALVWTMGITGYLNMTITVVTMVAAAMIMGLGIDFGIHIVYSYFENRKKHSKKKSLSETMQELLRATIAASLTTSAGFLALLFGVLPAMKTLGVVLAIGIISTLIGAVFLLPIIVYAYDKEKQKSKI